MLRKGTGLLLLAVLLMASTAQAGGTVEMLYRYGGTDSEVLMDALALADGGFALAGSTLSNDGDVRERMNTSKNYADAWMVRTEADGSIRWQKLIGRDDAMYEQFSAVGAAGEGLLAAAYMRFGAEKGEARLLIVEDATGETVHDYPLPEDTQRVYMTQDGCLAHGWGEMVAASWGGDVYRSWLALTGFDGETRWRRNYADDMLPWRPGAAVDFEGEMTIAGIWREDLPYSGNVVRLGGDGAVRWNTVMEVGEYGSLNALRLDESGDIVAVGADFGSETPSVGTMARLGADGSLKWFKKWPHDGVEGWFTDLAQAEGGMLVCGSQYREDDGGTPSLDGWLLLIDADGNTVWETQRMLNMADGLLRHGADGSIYLLPTNGGGDFVIARVLLP